MSGCFNNSVLLLIDLQVLWSKSPEIKAEFPDYRQNTRDLISFARKNGLEIVHIYVDCVENKSLWLKQVIKQWNRFGFIASDTWELKNNQPDSRLVQPLENERIFIKNNFDAFTNPKLNAYLKERNITTVYVAGLISSVCVINTINGSLVNGFETCVVSDCCGDFSRKLHDILLFDGYQKFIKHFSIKNGWKEIIPEVQSKL
eukprot:26835_1